jgi:hypothetical protein
VYFSIALATEVDRLPVDPSELDRQANQINNLLGLSGVVSKPVSAYVVAFDEQAWLPIVAW